MCIDVLKRGWIILCVYTRECVFKSGSEILIYVFSLSSQCVKCKVPLSCLNKCNERAKRVLLISNTIFGQIKKISKNWENKKKPFS